VLVAVVRSPCSEVSVLNLVDTFLSNPSYLTHARWEKTAAQNNMCFLHTLLSCRIQITCLRCYRPRKSSVRSGILLPHDVDRAE
jgi:hypothetical protein